jgi:hypothetical protein
MKPEALDELRLLVHWTMFSPIVKVFCLDAFLVGHALQKLQQNEFIAIILDYAL